MLQKILAQIYNNQVTKTYTDEDLLFCNFVLEYENHIRQPSKIACFSIGIEPSIYSSVKAYQVDIEIYSVPNTQYNNGKAYTPMARVYSILPLRDEKEIELAKESINRWYRDINKMPFK